MVFLQRNRVQKMVQTAGTQAEKHRLDAFPTEHLVHT